MLYRAWCVSPSAPCCAAAVLQHSRGIWTMRALRFARRVSCASAPRRKEVERQEAEAALESRCCSSSPWRCTRSVLWCALRSLRAPVLRASARAHILRFRMHSSYCLSPTRPAPSHQRWDGQGSPSPAPADALVQSLLTQEALLTPLKHRESHYTRLLAEHAAQVRDVRARSSCRVGSCLQYPHACAIRACIHACKHTPARLCAPPPVPIPARACSAHPNPFSLSVCLPPAVSLPMRQGHIPEGEVEQYRQQYGIVQQLTYMLETEPHNTPKLLHLMQLLQVFFFILLLLFLCFYVRDGAALSPSPSLSPSPLLPTPFSLPPTLLLSIRNLEIHLQTQQRTRAFLSRPHRPHDDIR
jgi:hypothetical protein